MSDIKAVIGALPVYHGVVPENTNAERQSARMTVADQHEGDDLLHLLEMLGLMPRDDR